MEPEDLIGKNLSCYDRFTFDAIFRFLLGKGFLHEEAKDFIIIQFSLSALIFQERLYNSYYLKIVAQESLSEDLMNLINECYNKSIGINIELN